MEVNNQSIFVGKVRRLQRCEKIYGFTEGCSLLLYKAIFDVYTSREETIPLLYALKMECIGSECLGIANELDTFILSTGDVILDGIPVLTEETLL